jgi:FkbM family methyltransferase
MVEWKEWMRAIRRKRRARQNPDASFVPLTTKDIHPCRVLNKATGKVFELFLRNGSSDWTTFEQVYVAEEYRLSRMVRHRELTGLYHRLCASGRTPLIIDGGANIGLATRYFAELFPQARIAAVEPQAGNIAIARKNCSSPNVVFLQGGIAAQPGYLQLLDPGCGENAYRTEVAAQDTGLRAYSIPEILAEHGGGLAPMICKIDIEGFEHNLFSIDSPWIEQFPLLIVELHDWLFPGQARSRPFLKQISAHDRDFVLLGENVFSMANHIATDG